MNVGINLLSSLLIMAFGYIMTGALIFTYSKDRGYSKASKSFLMSRLLLPLAWIVQALQMSQENIMLCIVSNGLMFVSVTMEFTAILSIKEYDTDLVRKRYLWLLGIGIFIFMLFAMLGADVSLRISVSSFILVVLTTYPLQLLLRDKTASATQRLITMIYAIGVVSLLVRGVAAMFLDIDMLWSSTSFYNTWLLVMICIVMMIGGVGFVLLEREQHDTLLVRAASLDGLTDILNRKTFLHKAMEVIEASRHDHLHIGFLLIDIDDFKTVNDVHGHYVGDAVLQDFAKLLKSQLRSCDLFGRFGGEEFAILLPSANHRVTRDVAERLRATIEGSSFELGGNIQYTISIGYHSVKVTATTKVDEMYQKCDQALYGAKAKGKNCCMQAIEA